MQVVSKVIRLDLNYASEVSHLYQKRTCYIAPYKTELAEHFARRLLAYLSLFEFSPNCRKQRALAKRLICMSVMRPTISNFGVMLICSAKSICNAPVIRPIRWCYFWMKRIRKN